MTVFKLLELVYNCVFRNFQQYCSYTQTVSFIDIQSTYYFIYYSKSTYFGI